MRQYGPMRQMEPSVLTTHLVIVGCLLVWVPWQIGRLLCRWLGWEETCQS